MSESIRDLLTRGIAAAKARDREEARFFLEWVLRRGDADRDQQAAAWLWLSEVGDDLAERRECLENVLANDPNHPLARRGMALLEGRLKQEDIVDRHEQPRPMEPSVAPGPTTARRYVCPKCGAKMAYDAGRRIVACDYCDNRMWEYDAVMGGALGSIEEQDFAATLPTVKAHRWELAIERVLGCQGCGATFTLPPACISGQCPFCESPHIVQATESRELIQPKGVLPFQFDDETVTKHVRRWLKKQRFRPGDLDKKAATIPPRGVYLPFWTFDIGGEVKWNCLVRERGYDQRDRWVPRQGSQIALHDDLLVPASHSLPADLLINLTGFDSRTALVPYSIDLLADWPAEIYQIPLADASLVARQRALEEAQARVKTRLFGEVRDLSFNTMGLTINSYKLVLLPVWVTGYDYKEERYPLLVNGQRGNVAGSVPRSGFQKFVAGLLGET